MILCLPVSIAFECGSLHNYRLSGVGKVAAKETGQTEQSCRELCASLQKCSLSQWWKVDNKAGQERCAAFADAGSTVLVQDSTSSYRVALKESYLCQSDAGKAQSVSESALKD